MPYLARVSVRWLSSDYSRRNIFRRYARLYVRDDDCKRDGRSLPEIIGKYLGLGVRDFVRVFSIFLMVLVGAVFLLSPAQLLGTLVPSVPQTWWVGIILVYYVVATMLPVDKVIGKLYPIFGAALIMMALGLLGALLVGDYAIPEMTTFHNYQLNPHALPIIPAMFITIACGAISGFHATQSPMMARCVGNEKECRMVFYGAMISEKYHCAYLGGSGNGFLRRRGFP